MLSYDKTPTAFYGSRSNSLSSASQPPSRMAKSAPKPNHRHLFIVTGPAGCGKSTVGKHVADQNDFPYIEGDEFHPKANVDKMASGIPLNDADRWDWLILLREQAVNALEAGAPGVVVTCSALKHKYRDVIRIASINDHDVLVHFIYLRASEELLMARVKARKGHYMKDSMIRSQMEALEEPDKRETDVSSIDVSGSISEVEKLASDTVTNVMAQDSVEQHW